MKNHFLDIYAIVTVDSIEVEEAEIFKLIDSCKREKVKLILVYRGKTTQLTKLDSYVNNLETFSQIVVIDDCGISSARNAGLKLLKEISPEDQSIVIFPDDDCVLPNGYRNQIECVFSEESVDFILGTYFPSEREAAFATVPESRLLNLKQITDKGSSAGIAVRAKIPLSGLLFDPHFGAGSILHSSEDIDFLASLHTQRYQGCFAPEIWMKHPRKNSPVNRRIGVAAVSLRYARFRPRLLLRATKNIAVYALESRDSLHEKARSIFYALSKIL